MATHSSVFAWRIPLDRGSCWAAVHRVMAKESHTTEATVHARMPAYHDPYRNNFFSVFFFFFPQAY